jgi:hypothetical protein
MSSNQVASTIDQNILPVQALFDVQGNFQTFIGQGKQFSTGGGTSLTIADITTNASFYPVFSAVSSGTVTVLDVTSTKLIFNPSTGILSSTGFSGSLTGNASGLSGGSTGALPYQSAVNTTTFLSAGTNGQVLTLSGGLPTWATASSGGLTITDDTTTNATRYLTFTSATSGSITGANTSSTKLQFNPSTGVLTATGFSGIGTSLTALNASNISSGTLGVAYGGTGLTSTPANGALDIGNGTGFTRTTLTAGSGISVTNGSGSISIANTGVTVYPGAGIANSTGSAWGTSYTTNGSGTVVALATSPSFTTPALGVATATRLTSTEYVENSVAVSASAIDLNAGNYFTKTISGTTTFTISNPATSGLVNSFILQLTNGGSATVNWFSGVKWAGGTAPTLTASGVDVLGFYTLDGGTTYEGFVLGKAMA